MRDKKVIERYETEISYQKHMIENLHRWQNLLFMISAIAIVLLYFFHRNIILTILLVLAAGLAGLGAWIFGMGIYKGQRNVNKIIDAYEIFLKTGKASC